MMRLRSAGLGVLEFARSDHRTVVTHSVAHSPLRLCATRAPGNAAHVVVTSFGGGLLGGDALTLQVGVRRGAEAMLSTQASTRIYGSDEASRQELHAQVDDDALLVVTPEPLVPFADSHFAQAQTFRLAQRASLVLVDWVSGGRWSRGEHWAMARYESRIAVRVADTDILTESLLLDRESGGLPTRMGRFNNLVTIVLAGPATFDAGRRLLADVGAAPARTDAAVLVGASPLAGHGVILRLATTSTERARQEIRSALDFLWKPPGDKPLPLADHTLRASREHACT